MKKVRKQAKSGLIRPSAGSGLLTFLAEALGDIPVNIPFFELVTLLVDLFAAGQGDFELNPVVVAINSGGNNGEVAGVHLLGDFQKLVLV